MAYFVTGATGFIGRFLLAQLLQREGTIYALCRASSLGKLDELRERLGDTEGRIVPIVGDLGRERLGVRPEDVERLDGRIEHFFHLAAIYDLTADADSQRIANVEGTRHAVHLAEAFGRVRAGNRDPAYRGPYLMAAGCNVAITAELYLAAGGFPRTAIEELHEDRALVNAVRRITADYARRSDVVVAGSSRRVRAWGLRRTLLWYKDHAYRPAVVDIR